MASTNTTGLAIALAYIANQADASRCWNVGDGEQVGAEGGKKLLIALAQSQLQTATGAAAKCLQAYEGCGPPEVSWGVGWHSK